MEPLKTMRNRKLASQPKERGTGTGTGATRISTPSNRVHLNLLVVVALLFCHNSLAQALYIDEDIMVEEILDSDEVEVEIQSENNWQKAYQDLTNKLATLQAEFTHLENLMFENSHNINSLRSEVYIDNSSISHTIISLETQVHNVASVITENKNNIRALQSGLNTIQNSVLTNQNHIRALGRRTSVSTSRSTTNATQLPASVTTPTTRTLQPTTLNPENSPVVLNCGGRIPTYAKGESKLMTYKNNQTYSNNERCLWSLDNEVNNTRSNQTLRIKLIRHGFAEPVDWLYALKFNRESGLVSQKIEMGQEYTFSEDQLYLSFTSDHSITGNGFELQLTVIDSVETGRGWVKYSSSSSGVAEGGAYVDNDLFNIVINPKTNINFEVNFVRIENHRSCDYDRLLVWEIGPVGDTAQKARLCGDISTTSSSFTTPNPVIAVFSADGSNTGPSNAGFQVSWKSN